MSTVMDTGSEWVKGGNIIIRSSSYVRRSEICLAYFFVILGEKTHQSNVTGFS